MQHHLWSDMLRNKTLQDLQVFALVNSIWTSLIVLAPCIICTIWTVPSFGRNKLAQCTTDNEPTVSCSLNHNYLELEAISWLVHNWKSFHVLLSRKKSHRVLLLARKRSWLKEVQVRGLILWGRHYKCEIEIEANHLFLCGPVVSLFCKAESKICFPAGQVKACWQKVEEESEIPFQLCIWWIT